MTTPETTPEEQRPRRHVTVPERRLARVYAEALLNLAEKKGQVQEIKDDLRTLVDVGFNLTPQLGEFLVSPVVALADKERVLRATFEGKLHPDVFQFLLVLNQNGRLPLVRPSLAAYEALDDERRRRIAVQVHSAEPLTDDQMNRLQANLRAQFKLEPVLHPTVDPDLLGGLVVRVGDWLFDASVRSRLQLLRKQLIASSSHEIQRERDRFSSDA